MREIQLLKKRNWHQTPAMMLLDHNRRCLPWVCKELLFYRHYPGLKLRFDIPYFQPITGPIESTWKDPWCGVGCWVNLKRKDLMDQKCFERLVRKLSRGRSSATQCKANCVMRRCKLCWMSQLSTHRNLSLRHFVTQSSIFSAMVEDKAPAFEKFMSVQIRVKQPHVIRVTKNGPRLH